MTPRESVEAVLKGSTLDRIPFSIYENKISPCAAERQLRNQGMCIVRRDVPVYKTHSPEVTVSNSTYTKNGKQLTRTDCRTPVGTLHTISEQAGPTSWTHERLFKKPEDYKPLLYIINNMQFEPNYNAFQYAQDVDGGDTFFRGNIGSEPMQQLISGYMGIETFCIEWFDNRDEVLKLYDALVCKRREVYPLCANSPALAFNYGGNVTPEVLGLERFETYYVPHYNEAADVLHTKGKLIGVHFDGNCKALATAIADTNLDYVEAFTPAQDTDMTLAEARQAWPHKILWMNFPSSVHLASLETIRQTTHDLLDQAGSCEKFIMAITENMPEDRWRANLLEISNVLCSYKVETKP
jgi:hypothetical protein